ncbi:HlyD family secretion protein [Spirochaeta lutea]|uniref:AprE-like beta-barrel domain-containing protein n=1 Tax=Spirochaeta lutea TaxID=1480694 RepID=A0A098QZH3_9SPIO|nr:HlyD family efflux transporter periplasmic adaptor subunit [Spirochaeta lutea]KGE72808.1 hypothetical protein DC28_05370 [Spirochaeta lutea]
MNILSGDVIKHSREFYELSRPIICRVGILLICLFCLSLLGWSFLFSVEDVAYGIAETRPVANPSLISPGSSGIVQTVHVKDGDLVEAGEILVTMNITEQQIQLNELKPRLKTAFENLYANQVLLHSLSGIAAPQYLGGGYEQVLWEDFNAEKRLRTHGIRTIEYELSIEMEKPQLLQSMVTIRRLELQREQLSLDLLRWEHQRILQATQIIQNTQEEVGSLQAKIAFLEKQVNEANIPASITGRVHNMLKLNPGDRVALHQPLLELVPGIAGVLKVQIQVTPAEIVSIQPGMKVIIHFESLPINEYEPIVGTVVTIPADSSHTHAGEPVYFLEAEIPSLVKHRESSSEIPIPPGIIGEARIILQRRKIIHFILEVLDWV